MRTALSILLAGVCVAAQGQLYHVTDLGTLGSFALNQDAWALGINNSGGITGVSGASDGTLHPFYWANGVMTDLGFPTGTAYAINNSGAMVLIHAGDALVGTAGSFLAIPNAGGQAPYGINNLGQVVGGYSYPYLYTPGSTSGIGGGPTQILPTLGYAAVAVGINDLGNVVGYAAVGPPYPNHAVLWTNGAIQDLGTLGGTASVAEAINNSNQIVGYGTFAGDNIWHACLWSNGLVADLGTLGGMNSVAQAVNSLGQIVGYADLPGTSSIFPGGAPTALQPGAEQGHAFLYSNGLMLDLNTLVDSSGTPYILESANGINDNGQIIAMGFDPADAQEHAVLLTPLSPPAVTEVASTNTLWPPDGRTVPVTISGTITSAGSGTSTATYSVVDSYGKDQPSGTVTVNSDGTYSFSVGLVARRKGSDLTGRTYTITVTAQNQIGLSGSASVTVKVPHSQ